MCIHCAVSHNPSDYVHLMICWLSSLQVSERNVKTSMFKRGTISFGNGTVLGEPSAFLNVTFMAMGSDCQNTSHLQSDFHL